MAQYLYVIDTGITTTSLNGISYPEPNPLAVGQTTYDLVVKEKFRHGIVPIENTVGLWRATDDDVGIYVTDKYLVGIGTSVGIGVGQDYQLMVTGAGTSTTQLNVVGVTTIGGATTIGNNLYISGFTTIGGATTIGNNLYISGFTTSTTYTSTGTLSSTSTSATNTIDASTTQLYHHSAVFSTSTTFQISNLTDGKYVYLYIKNNSTVSAPQISITASETTSGYTAVYLSRSGSRAVTEFNIDTEGGSPTRNGTAVVWVANIDGNLVGSLS